MSRDPLPSPRSETFDIEGSPTDLYANAEALRHETGSPQEKTERGAPSPRHVNPDLYADAEALRRHPAFPPAGHTGSSGSGQRLVPSDVLKLRSDSITRTDLLLMVLVPTIFFLGFLLGRSRRRLPIHPGAS